MLKLSTPRHAVGEIGLDHVPETKLIVLAEKVFCQGDRADVELKLAVFPDHIAARYPPEIIKRIRIIGNAGAPGESQRNIL